jgi:hypothetical protein
LDSIPQAWIAWGAGDIIIKEKVFLPSIDNNLLPAGLSLISMSMTSSIYYGPHLLPEYLGNPIRIYPPKLNRNLIGVENRKRTVIYQWMNLINGKIYVGSA